MTPLSRGFGGRHRDDVDQSGIPPAATAKRMKKQQFCFAWNATAELIRCVGYSRALPSVSFGMGRTMADGVSRSSA
jgi:hypothetical protein